MSFSNRSFSNRCVKMSVTCVPRCVMCQVVSRWRDSTFPPYCVNGQPRRGLGKEVQVTLTWCNRIFLWIQFTKVQLTLYAKFGYLCYLSFLFLLILLMSLEVWTSLLPGPNPRLAASADAIRQPTVDTLFFIQTFIGDQPPCAGNATSLVSVSQEVVVEVCQCVRKPLVLLAS